MHIVVVANAIVKEGFGYSALSRFFLSSSRLVGYSICIPDLVIKEVTATFGNMIDREAKRAKTLP